MEIKSFDTILTSICDDFDELISPAKLARTNTNIVYLLLKAISKGWEIINNVCVVLNNKFNPLLCSDEDLVSTGKLVGTKMRAGSVSGLRISVYNSGITPVTLLAGSYDYQLDDEVKFTFIVETDTAVNAESSVYFTALSENVGAFRVTQQEGITVTANVSIPSSLIFSCTDNLPLLGHAPETILEFRQRVNTDIERQDIINELKEKLLALPYVYDCTLVFNQEESSMVVGDYTIPPFYLLVIISTAMYTNEIADVIAQSAIYPTVNVPEESHEVKHMNDVFINGYYSVWLNDFKKKDFEITINAVIDSAYNTASNVESKIESALMNAFNSNIYRPSITAEDVFAEINELELTGVKVYGVSFTVGSSELDYVTFDKTELPNLTNVGGI